MLDFLKNHPFAVSAFFKTSVVLTYAVPIAGLESLIPKHLELDTYNDKYGFVAVALVQTSQLRPKGFPKWMGRDFFLAGYRIFVRYRTLKGRNLRGLFILRSETDSRRMQLMGNFFTHYHYSFVKFKTESDQGIYSIGSEKGLKISVRADSTNIALPPGSPFTNWKDARRYAGPLPFTFSYNENRKEMTIVEGVRSGWEPQPLAVLHAHVPFVQSLQFPEAILANAFLLTRIPYSWKKGAIEKWK